MIFFHIDYGVFVELLIYISVDRTPFPVLFIIFVHISNFNKVVYALFQATDIFNWFLTVSHLVGKVFIWNQFVLVFIWNQFVLVTYL